MPSTLTALRYLTLLQIGGISSATLETELSGSTVRKGDFNRLFSNKTFRNNILNSAYSIVRSSATAFGMVLTRGYVMSNDTVSQGISYASETNISIGHPFDLQATPACNNAIKYSTTFLSRYNQTSSDTVYLFRFFQNMFTTLSSTTTSDSSNPGCVGTMENGYTAGGDTGGSSWVTTMERMAYAVEVTSAIAAVLTDNRRSMAGVSSSTAGYFIGGTDAGLKTEVDGLTFLTEAAYNPAVVLGTATAYMGAGESLTKGYIFGGSTGSAITGCQSFTFATEAFATLASSLSVARNSLGATQYGAGNYLFGGTGDTTQLTRFPHATETLADVNESLAAYTTGTQAGMNGGGF